VPARPYASLHEEHMNATGPLVPDWLTRRIADSLKTAYLNPPVWKIVAIAGVVSLMLAVVWCWARVVRAQGRRGSELRRLAWRFSLPVVLIATYSLSAWFVISHIDPRSEERRVGKERGC